MSKPAPMPKPSPELSMFSTEDLIAEIRERSDRIMVHCRVPGTTTIWAYKGDAADLMGMVSHIEALVSDVVDAEKEEDVEAD